MLKVNNTEIENVKFNEVDLDKVVINGVTVFEKSKENTITMRTLQDSITLTVKTKDDNPCEVWNAGKKIGVLNHNQRTGISIPNKNEDIIIKGKDITYFQCGYNQLTSLNVQGLTALQDLRCYNNQLTSLNVQGLTALREIQCGRNQLTSLNVQGLTALQVLDCYSNQLTSLNVQGLTALQDLDCYRNQLTSLNVQGLTALQVLDCYGNQLTAQAFSMIFNNLLETTRGRSVVYRDGDNNYKDFTRPPELVEAFNGAKMRGWLFYKNYKNKSNLIL